MSNVRISKTGRKVLRDYHLTRAITNAIVANGEKLHSKEGLIIVHNGKRIVLRCASFPEQTNQP